MALLAHFKDKITLEESCPIKKHIVPSTNSQLDIHPSCKFSLGRKPRTGSSQYHPQMGVQFDHSQ